jgi:hypothetical protein
MLGKAGQIDLETAVVDSASVRAVFGGSIRDRIPQIEARRAVSVM